MNKKIILWMLLIIILYSSIVVGSETLSVFSTGTTPQNITIFNTNLTKKDIILPLYITVNNATLYMKNTFTFINITKIDANCTGTITNCANSYDNDFDTVTGIATSTVIFNQNFSYNKIGFNYRLHNKYGIHGGVAAGFTNMTVYCYNYSSNTYIHISNRTRAVDSWETPGYVSNISKDCLVSGNNIAIRSIGDPATGGFVRYYEAEIDAISYLDNLSINLSDNIIYKKAGLYHQNSKVNFTTGLRSAIPSCNCSNCTTISNSSGEFCRISMIFNSSLSGILELSKLEINYSFKNSFFNVTIFDSNTLKIITGTNFTIEFISDSYNKETTTESGFKIFNISLNDASSFTYLVRVKSTHSIDYNIVQRESTIEQGQNYTLIVYVTNTSNSATSKVVTLHAQDENRNNLDNALITVLKQDPSTGNFIILTEMRTNPNGEATTTLELNTVFYKFFVDYQGSRIFTSNNAIPISTVDDDIFLIGALAPSYTDYYESLFGLTSSLTYSDITNASGRFESTYSYESQIEMCLEVLRINSTNSTRVFYSCENSTSGAINSNTISPANVTLYTAQLLADFKDGFGKRFIRSKSEYIGQGATEKIDKTEALFFLYMLIVTAGLGVSIKEPVPGLILLCLGLIGIFLTKLTPLSATGLMLLLSLTIITLITWTRVKK